MSKLIIEPIQIHISGDHSKISFIWRKRLYRVKDILSWWREPSEWWNGEPIRCFLRVNAKNLSVGTYEIFKNDKSWFLYRILD